MPDHSAIEWTNAPWNPATGCTKLSAGWGGRTPKAGGNVLDGRQWLAYPTISSASVDEAA